MVEIDENFVDSLPTPRSFPRIPNIAWANITRDELALVNPIETALISLGHAVQRFGQAVDLFNHANSLVSQGEDFNTPGMIDGARLRARLHWVYGPWAIIAASAAIICLRDFQEVMTLIINHARAAPPLTGRFNLAQLNAANKRFDSEFPKISLIRNSVAHPGTDFADPKVFDKNAFTGPIERPGLINGAGGGKGRISGLDGTKYFCTIHGEIVECDVSEATFETITEICDQFLFAFVLEDSSARPA